MNRKLPLALALIATLASAAQSGHRLPANAGVENTAKRIALRLEAEASYNEQNAAPSSGSQSSQDQTPGNPVATKTSSYISSWKIISSSANAYGVAVGTSRPLHYNEDLNAVSFILRAGPGYMASPAPAQNAVSGVLVGMVTQTWGATWDSTCMWNDNNNWARYPQGDILNSVPGNTNIANAHMVTMAPITTQAGGWIGNAYSVKSLSSYTNVAPSTNSFFPTLSPTLNKSDFTVYDCQTTDDGKVLALGYVNNDPNGNTAAQFGYRGASLIKGSFVSGNMIWSSDSIIPSVVLTNGTREVIARPRMVWSEDGQIGYVVHIGVAASSTLSNRGYQPLIHRTSNGGQSWAAVSGIDFEAPSMSVALNNILSTRSNTNLTVPFFDYSEGMGMTVDKDGKLHIAALIRGTSSPHPDSLGFTYLLTHADGENYVYGHRPGLRPFLFDFTGDGLPNSPWKVTLVDSLASESPGIDPVNDPRGYVTNPWTEHDGGKLGVESRIQLSRTADGRYIVYSWVESDTSLTSTGLNGFSMKWNELPDIKCRVMDVTAQTIHSVEINVTRPGVSNPNIVSNPAVASRAYLHYISPKCVLAQTVTVGPEGPAIALPITTSRPHQGSLPPDAITVHRYMTAVLNFGRLSQNQIELPGSVTGIVENALNSVKQSLLYPNPAVDQANLAIGLADNSKVELSVVNLMGQTVKHTITNAEAGQNTINIDLNSLSKGVYMVNVKIGTVTSAKKLVIE